MESKPFLCIDIEIRSENMPPEVIEAIKKSMVMFIQMQKAALPFIIYDVQDKQE